VGPSFSPLADALDLRASAYSPWLVESAVRLGTTTTFRAAARLLTHFTGVAMHAGTIRRLTEGAGSTVRQLERTFAATVQATGTVPDPPPDTPLQLSIDGSLVHLREEGWREVKLLAVGERAADGTAPLTALTYTGTLGDVTTFGDDALGELGRRGVPQATDVVSVNDGAVWIQELLDLQCPQAVRVLDFAHAAGYLAEAAKATWTDPATVDAWFTTQRHELLSGEPDQVLAALGALPASEARDTALGYLTSRRAQIAYQDFVARGWPIGSGCVESAHQHVVQDRLKGRGMRWRRCGAEALLAVRVVDANDRWEETWGPVGPAQRSAARARTAERRADRAQPPPRPKQVIAGKPVPSHCWRRFRLPGAPRFRSA
jgi:hypothetical protein